jgi:uncharacterized protein
MICGSGRDPGQNDRSATLYRGRGAAILSAAMALFAASSAQVGAATPDCPSAHAPYSSETVLLDLLIDPRAAEVLKAHGLFQSVPPNFATPPTISAILSPRQLMASRGETALAALDRDLAAIPITDEAALRRCARYDHGQAVLPKPDHHPAILVFEKINGFRDGPSVQAAHKAFSDMAGRRGWSIAFTDNGAVFSKPQLQHYDAIVWNNVSGDALTVSQENAFKAYLAAGGGFAGVHGSGGDPVYVWGWYADSLIGARFIGHPMNPQFQSATVIVEGPKTGIAARLPDSWTMTEEWYSFASSPRLTGARILARLDERSYKPSALAMGDDHPIAWAHCLGDGRSFYTAIGHRPESYAEPNSIELLEQGVAWAAGLGETRCKAGREVMARPPPRR